MVCFLIDALSASEDAIDVSKEGSEEGSAAGDTSVAVGAKKCSQWSDSCGACQWWPPCWQQNACKYRTAYMFVFNLFIREIQLSAHHA